MNFRSSFASQLKCRLGLMQVFAFILGSVALFQPNRKRIFAVLGTIFSLMALLSIVGLMILSSV